MVAKMFFLLVVFVVGLTTIPEASAANTCACACEGKLANAGDPHLVKKNNAPDILFGHIVTVNQDLTPFVGNLIPITSFGVTLRDSSGIIVSQALDVGLLKPYKPNPQMNGVKFVDSKLEQEKREGFSLVDIFEAMEGGVKTWNVKFRLHDEDLWVVFLVFNPELTLEVEINGVTFCYTGAWKTLSPSKIDLTLPGVAP